MFTNMDEVLEFIHGTSWMGVNPGLSRIAELMGLLGDPQKSLKFIHIAGTNGKGSTAAMLASVLAEAGYKTGLYTSPPIHKINERMQINGRHISDEELIKVASLVGGQVRLQKDPTTVFETMTAIALLYFHRQNCDIVVFEVGMGGRLDATNIIPTPEVAVITSIGLDHMEVLGDTVEKIAGEKAGIIKPGGTVVCHPQAESVEGVIREKCRKESASCTFVNENEITLIETSLDGQRFDFIMPGEGQHASVGFSNATQNFTIPLLGNHQLRNAAVAITTIEALREKGWKISADALRVGLCKTFWPGRFEVMRKSPVFIIDGAHNPQGVQTAVDNLSALFPGKKPLFIFGVLQDKDFEKMLEILAPIAGRFLTITPPDSRALPAADLAEILSNRGIPATPCETIQRAVSHAIEISAPEDIICAIGSLTTVGAIREILQ